MHRVAILEFAGFRYQQTTKVTGGSLVSMAKLRTFSKQAHSITDPTNSTILVKGNRMAHINPDSTEVIDLDQETITRMDHAKKQYTVVTFQEMKAAMEEAVKKAQAQPQQAPTPQPASTTPPPQMKFKVTVTNTGTTKPVAGLSASESILKMTAEATDQQSGQTGGMAITNDMWMVPEIPGYSEVRDFNSRMAVKMGTVFSGAMPSSVSPQMLSSQPGMGSGMADMAKEMWNKRRPGFAGHADGDNSRWKSASRRFGSATSGVEWSERRGRRESGRHQRGEFGREYDDVKCGKPSWQPHGQLQRGGLKSWKSGLRRLSQEEAATAGCASSSQCPAKFSGADGVDRGDDKFLFGVGGTDTF